MQQIIEWLAGLGLGRCARVFDENGIDFGVLPNLTDQDVEKLDVLLGHRRKLLRSIANLKGIASDALSLQVALATATPRPLDAAERRQVTVMFSDLVGSTALSSGMDPEDLREVISAYQKCGAETLCRFDGFVAKYMGDGVPVYFGYPQAHEDDAERVVRAVLELIGRAGMSMARLWRDQGKQGEACDLLGPGHGWFTEGFDTLDLMEAKELLEQLKP